MTADVTTPELPESAPQPQVNAQPRPPLAEFPIVVALLGVAVGLAIIALHHFRAGTLVVASAIIAAALLRLLLPSRRAGLLVVRGRIFDVAVLGGLGLGMLALGLAVPP